MTDVLAEPEPPELAKFTTKQLVAFAKRRGHGTDQFTLDQVNRAIGELSLGDLAKLKRDILALFEYKQSLVKGLTEEELELLAKRDFMGCVKAIRERTGLGIADAKTFLDKHKPGGAG